MSAYPCGGPGGYKVLVVLRREDKAMRSRTKAILVLNCLWQ